MHMLFFGGMSQYYYNDTTLIKDDDVPFVNTISRLSRNSSGVLKEFQMPEQMPGLVGSSAEFIANETLSHTDTEIILLQPNDPDSLLIGHIVGGIHSPSKNPFSANNTGTTKASETIYEVVLVKADVNSAQPIDGQNPFKLHSYQTRLLTTSAYSLTQMLLIKSIILSQIVLDKSYKLGHFEKNQGL